MTNRHEDELAELREVVGWTHEALVDCTISDTGRALTDDPDDARHVQTVTAPRFMVRPPGPAVFHLVLSSGQGFRVTIEETG